MSDDFEINWDEERGNVPYSRQPPVRSSPPPRRWLTAALVSALVCIAVFGFLLWPRTAPTNPVLLQLLDTAGTHRIAADKCRSGEIDSMLAYEKFIIDANKESKRKRFGYRSEALDKFNTAETWNGDAVATIADTIAKDYEDATN